jgi:dolichol-phosphate mannosyltransferase
VLINSLALFLLYGKAGLPLVVASAVSVELAITNNFVWNDRWTFGCSAPSWLRFVKFNLISLVGLAVTTGTAWLLVQQAGVNYLVANLAGIGLATACNFLANAQWTWRL